MIPQTPTSGARNDEGFALVAVLGFLLIAASIITPFAVTARTDHLIAASLRHRTQLDSWSEAIATTLSLYLAAGTEEVRLPTNSSPVSCTIGDFEVGITYRDQAGLVDLNAASKDLMALGFLTLGFDERLSAALAEAVVLYRTYGAQPIGEAADIKVAGGLKNAPLESVIELHDFEPLRDVETADLHRTFSVHSRRETVSLAHAPADLRQRLELTPGERSYGDEMAAASFALEVVVQDPRRAIRGYSGAIFLVSDHSDARVRRVEPLFQASLQSREIATTQACSPVLHELISELVRGASLDAS